MTEPIEVRKLAMHLPVSEELAADAAQLKAGFEWAMNATPKQWAARQAEMKQARAVERAAAVRVPLDLARVLEGLAWSTQYAEHFVQDYCTCSQGYDGWDFCPHARDEGVAGG